jgi:hypothetical protein
MNRRMKTVLAVTLSPVVSNESRYMSHGTEIKIQRRRSYQETKGTSDVYMSLPIKILIFIIHTSIIFLSQTNVAYI